MIVYTAYAILGVRTQIHGTLDNAVRLPWVPCVTIFHSKSTSCFFHTPVGLVAANNPIIGDSLTLSEPRVCISILPLSICCLECKVSTQLWHILNFLLYDHVIISSLFFFFSLPTHACTVFVQNAPARAAFQVAALPKVRRSYWLTQNLIQAYKTSIL